MESENIGEKIIKWKTAYGELAAGILIIAGTMLAVIMCIDTGGIGKHGLRIIIKPGQSALLWAILFVCTQAYNLLRVKVKTGYINPIFKIIWDAALFVPALGLILAMIGGAQILQSPAWENIVAASSAFLDSLVIFLLFIWIGVGINSLKNYFNGH